MNALLTNPFKERLRKGEVQIGLWLSSTTSYMAEIAATSGYDWLLIDGEHAPNTRIRRQRPQPNRHQWPPMLLPIQTICATR